jgi:hypothetical protein
VQTAARPPWSWHKVAASCSKLKPLPRRKRTHAAYIDDPGICVGRKITGDLYHGIDRFGHTHPRIRPLDVTAHRLRASRAEPVCHGIRARQPRTSCRRDISAWTTEAPIEPVAPSTSSRGKPIPNIRTS